MEVEPLKNLELDKICRCCLTVKKEMRPLFGELIAKMLIECAQIQVEETDGWPDKICMQCVHQVSRFHSFKQRLERSDKTLRDYIKGLTVVVEEERIPVAQELAMAKIELPPGLAGQQFIARTANGHQVINGAPILTSSGFPQSMQIPPNTQLVHHNGQLIPVQMLPNNQAQVVQIRRAGDEACELIVQSRPSHHHQHQQQASVRTAEAHEQTHYYEETTATETRDYSKAEDVLEEDEEAEDEEELEEEEECEEEGYIVEEIQESEYELEIDQQHQNEEELVSDVEIFVDSRGQEVTQEDVVEVNDHENTPASPQKLTDSIEIEFVEDSDGPEETDLMAEFISQQTSCPTPGRHVCKLCQKEFKNSKSLYSHMKLHSNWFKANCKQMSQCEVCQKKFKGPGMLKMHMKVHEARVYVCDLCVKSFQNQFHLDKHRAKHNSPNASFFRCEPCELVFISNNDLRIHKRTHRNADRTTNLHSPAKRRTSDDNEPMWKFIKKNT